MRPSKIVIVKARGLHIAMPREKVRVGGNADSDLY